MTKFDKSTGFKDKEIAIIKDRLCRKIESELPNFSNKVETEIFFSSSGAWLFYWNVIDVIPKNGLANKIILEVTVKLKKKYHLDIKDHEFKFCCFAEVTDDIYTPIISTKKLA